MGSVFGGDGKKWVMRLNQSTESPNKSKSDARKLACSRWQIQQYDFHRRGVAIADRCWRSRAYLPGGQVRCGVVALLRLRMQAPASAPAVAFVADTCQMPNLAGSMVYDAAYGAIRKTLHTHQIARAKEWRDRQKQESKRRGSTEAGHVSRSFRGG